MWLSTALRRAEAEGLAQGRYIVLGRCWMCHVAKPVRLGLLRPPKGVKLETEAQIARQAGAILLHVRLTHAMPPANLAMISESERAQIRT